VSKWSAWEFALMGARPPAQVRRGEVTLQRGEGVAEAPQTPWPRLDAGRVQALTTIHYVAERGFFPQGFSLLDEAQRFEFPLYIVHGRRDCVCPVRNAKDLAAAVPRSELRITAGGHSQWDAENVDAFVDATDRLASAVRELA